MPVISHFFGIYVRMYHNDHHPPHVNVEYQGHEAFVDISTGEVLEGRLPKNAARLVKDWCTDHLAELAANLARAQALEPLERIPGADQ
jgi:uncharacterized protein DUF4160